MGHGYRPIVFKIEVLPPNRKSTKVRNKNLLKYIATREGVDLTKVNSFWDAMNENIDLNAEGEEKAFSSAPDEEYMKYIAFRPRSHGLFGNIDTENFAEVAQKLNKVSNEKKTVYRCTISLSELDGETLGYTNSAKWQLYLQSIMPDIATTINVSPSSMTWVAAFHAEATHPHVHLMLWDNREKVQNAFVNERQRTACWKICQETMFTEENERLIKEITAAERQEYMNMQKTSRDELLSLFKDIFKDNKDVPGAITETIPGRLSAGEHQQLNSLYKAILETIPKEGRIKYTFMPVECKAYIDRVTDIFLKRPEIKQEYDKYIKATENLHRSLGKTKGEINNQLKKKLFDKNDGIYTRIGNIVLKGVRGLKDSILNPEAEKPAADIELNARDADFDTKTESGQEAKFITEEPELEEKELEGNFEKFLSQSDAPVGLSELLNKKSDNYNPIEAEKIILALLKKDGNNQYKSLHYSLAEIYSNKELCLFDQEKAVIHLEKVLESDENHFRASALLGSIYSDKDFKGFDYKKAEDYYLKAIRVNPKRANFVKLRLSRIYADKEKELFNYEKALAILSDASDYVGSVSLQKGNIYAAMGQNEDAIHYYEQAASMENYYAAYHLGKIYTELESKFYEPEKGIQYLEMASDKIPRANFLLGRIYKEMEVPDYENSVNHLSKALNQFEEKEKKKFSKLSNTDKELKSNIYLQLGKIYADEQSSMFNREKADECFQNSYATLKKIDKDLSGRIALQKSILLSDAESLLYDMDKSMDYLAASAEAGNTTAQYRLGKIFVTPDSPYYSLKEGVKYLECASEKKFAPAMVKLGFLFSKKESEYENIYNLKSAMEYLQKALENGYKDDKGIVALRQGMIYADESYAEYNMESALSHLKKAANCGNTSAMVKIAKCYIYGIGVEKSHEMAEQWLQKAMQQGDEYASVYYKQWKGNLEKALFKGYSYALLRQIFSSMQQSRVKREMQLQGINFKTISKQVKKEEYLHQK